MQSNRLDLLDAEELLHVAITAAGEGRHADAIACLKAAAQRETNNAKILFMLGAEHAQVGLYDRAVVELQQAVDLDPSFAVARFQLGLLHLTRGDGEAALRSWGLLGALPEEEPLRLFKEGLEQLMANRFDDCRVLIERGIANNQALPALNQDMRRVLERLDVAASAAESDVEASDGAGPHLWLSAYRQEH